MVCITLSRKGAELRHRVFHFTLGCILDGLLRCIRGVLDELGDFDGVAEKDGGDLRHIVGGARAAAQVAAVHVGKTCFASGTNLQREPHVAGGNSFDVAALLDHGQQDVVPLVKQREFVPDLFQLQRDRLRILHLCHGP
ncbi:MAG: hypothetical protein WBC04_13235 [Candidatus Acidiferrales bacterium]